MPHYTTLFILLLLINASVADETRSPNCGPYSLYVAAGALQVDVGSFEEFYKTCGNPDARGFSLGQLEAISKRLGLKTYGVKTSADVLAQRTGRFGCIAWIRGNHFVLINAVENGQVSIIDPPRSYQVPVETFATQWDGTSLLISQDAILTDEEVLRQSRSLFQKTRWVWVAGAIGCLAIAIVRWRGRHAV